MTLLGCRSKTSTSPRSEAEIAAEGSRGWIAQVLADEAAFEFFPLRADAVDVGLGEDDLEPPAFHHATEQLNLVAKKWLESSRSLR